MDDPLLDVGAELKRRGVTVTAHDRRALGNREAAPWPSPGPYGMATLRLPRAKEELAMGLSAAASVLGPGSSILVYGANDEGIRGAVSLVGKVFSSADTFAVGGRCRVVQGVGPGTGAGEEASLEAWRAFLDLDYPDLPPHWVSYPGVFSHGGLDDGTRLLLDSVPSFSAGSRILDYGCGSGVIGYVVRERGVGLVVEMLDVDAVSLEAVRENMPGARRHLMDGLHSDDLGPYDAVVSNPPFHQGKAEDPSMIESFIDVASRLLSRKGSLVFVAQRRLSLERPLKKQFRSVKILAEDRTFRVWEGQKPKQPTRK